MTKDKKSPSIIYINKLRDSFKNMEKKFKVYKLTYGDYYYIGRTNNIKRRLNEHNSSYKKGKNKIFYNLLRQDNVEDLKASVEVEIIGEYNTLADSKRFELYTILDYHFKGKNLYQKIPNIYR